MIKNNNINNKYGNYYAHAPLEDSLEVYYDLDRIINWNFVDTAKKVPTFYNTHKPLASAITEQLEKGERNDQK